MHIEELEGGGPGIGEEERLSAEKLVLSDAKRVAVGVGARFLFYPTLLYNVVRNKIQAEFRWWDPVDEFLLLGAVPFPSDVPCLKQLGVSGVITLNEPYETLVPTSLYIAYGIEHLVIPTRDYCFAPSFGDIYKAVEFIHNNASCGKTTYVHCKAGRGRSTTIVLCYLVQHKQMTPTEAYDYVKSRRARVCLASAQWQFTTSSLKLKLKTGGITVFHPQRLDNASCGKTTYVHCKAGRGRSTTIVLCYLVQHKQMTPTEAYNYVKSRRPRVRLASAQWQAVQEYYRIQVIKVRRSSFVSYPIINSPALVAARNFVTFDDSSFVLVTKPDLEGYVPDCRTGSVWAELSLVYRVQFARQAALASLSCFWLRCHRRKEVAVHPDKKLGRESCSLEDQLRMGPPCLVSGVVVKL